MNERIEHCLYQAGLTAQGCWDELDDYAKQGIKKFAELLVQECIKLVDEEEDRFLCMGELDLAYAMANFQLLAKQHFGVGMSTEDKKTLIKELLGVKND